MALHERTFTENRAVALINKIALEVGQFLFWGKFMQFNTPDKKAVDPNKGAFAISDTPIVVHRELTTKQSDTIEVPLLRQLDDLPVTGLAKLQGLTERQKINHAYVHVNLWRSGVMPQSSSIMHQTTKELDLAKWAKTQLQQQYARVNAYLGVSWAFYNGFSWNVTNDSSWYAGAKAVSAVNHPHIYVAGNGKVTYGVADWPGTAAYNLAINTAVSGLLSSDVFDTDLLSGLRSEEQIRKIPYLYTKDGQPYRVIAAHHYQIASLLNDPDFKAIMPQSLSGAKELAKENPYLVGCKFVWEDWAIFDAGNCIFPVTAGAIAPVWGPSVITDLNSFEDNSAATAFGAIVLGDNAMFKALASPYEIVIEESDFKEVYEVAYRVIEGYARPDFKNLDDGVAGDHWLNDSSAIVITAAAKPTLT